MCGILGIFASPNAQKQIRIGLDLLKHRGHDGIGVASENNLWHGQFTDDIPNWNSSNLVGHCLHAVVNHIPQPLTNQQSRLVANCEIYNWRDLIPLYNDTPRNDAELLHLVLNQASETNLEAKLQQLQGDYAFTYWHDDTIWIARDLVGVKPIWYAFENEQFAFASERKALLAMGYEGPHELNPRLILSYNLRTHQLAFLPRNFYSIDPEHEKNPNILTTELLNLLISAVKKRIPSVPYGLMFSGGIDSVILAAILKKLGEEFPCYVAVADEKASDLSWSLKAAELLNLDLRPIIVSIDQIEEKLGTLVPLIEESTVMKVGVGLPFFFACQSAAKDGMKVLFSGMGADELFGGYFRQAMAAAVNEDCLSAIRGNYERNAYRDDVITMYWGLELRVPYLDPKVISYSLKIPSKFKIQEKQNKWILREVAKKINISQELSNRPKKAAQYGSRFDYYLKRLAKKEDCTRAEFLRNFLPQPSIKLGALFSTGKDSSFAFHVMRKRNYDVVCLITIQSENPDSYMFHTPTIELSQLQAEALGLPILIGKTKGEKEEELRDLERTLKQAIDLFKIQGVITGALYSNYQRQRIEKICDRLGIKCFSPLWHIDQEQEMRQLLREGFEIIFTSYAAYGLDASWLGVPITEQHVDRLVKLNRDFGINIAGEGGEFESFVTWMPGFSHHICFQGLSISKTGEWSGRIKYEFVSLCK